MPRAFLRRGNTPGVQCPYTMYPEDASAEDTRGSRTYKEGQYLTNNVEAAFQDVGDGPIDLSMSGSGKAWLSYQGSSPGNAQGMSDHLTLHEHPGWSTNMVNDGGGINSNSHLDIFAPPSQANKYPAIPDNYKRYNGGINQVRRSDLMQKSVPNYYTQRFSIDNRTHQSGDTVTQGYSSDESMKSFLLPERANNSLPSLEDIIRVVQDETGRQPGRSYCMSLLKSYYLDAVAKRDFVRDLLRELHTSCFQEQDFRHSTFRSSRDNRFQGHINAQRSRESIMDDFPAPYAPMETEPNCTFDAMEEDSHVTFLEETSTKAYGPERRINSNYNSVTSYGNGDAIRNTLYSQPVSSIRQYLPNVCQSSRKVSGQPSQGNNGTIPQPMSIEPRSSRGTHSEQQQHVSTTSDRQVSTSLSRETANATSFRKQNSPVHENFRLSQKTAVSSSMNFIPPNKGGVPFISKPSGDPQRSIPHFKTTQPMLEYTVLETSIPAKKSDLTCKENFHLKDTLDVSTSFTSIIENDCSTPQSNVIKSGTLKDTFSVGQAKPETDQGLGGGKHAPTPKLVNEQTPDHPDSPSLVICDSPSSGKAVVQFRRRTFDCSRQKHRCSTCSSTFNTERAYTRHMATEHNQKRSHICSFCEKGFQDKFDLKRHYRTHTGVRPYKCSICPRTFTQRCSLETHISKVHGMPLTFGFKERRKKIYVCEDCGDSVKDAYDHYLHMWISHSRLAMPKRLRHKVMHKIRKISQDGNVKSEEQLLADNMVVTQAIRCLRDRVQSQG